MRVRPLRAANLGPSLNRAVFLNQLVFGAVVIAIVCAVQLGQPHAAPPPLFFRGVAAALVATALAVIVPWHRVRPAFTAVIPLMDILAIMLIREGLPQAGFGLLFVFPVIWMASSFGKTGAIVSSALAMIDLWSTPILRGQSLRIEDATQLMTAPLIIIFVATTTYFTSRRAAAHRVLLRRQSDLLEAALGRARSQKRVLDEVLNAVDFGVVGFDERGKPTFVNQAMLRMLGGTPSHPVPRHSVFAADGITPLTEPELPFQRARRGDEFHNLVVWLGEKREGRVAHAVSARQFDTESGAPPGGVLVSRDITAELNAIQARDDLVASVSHELRTPLTSIVGYLELAMDDESVPPHLSRMLQIASTNADRLLVMISELLSGSSGEVHSSELALDDCDLDTLVRQAAEALVPASDDRGITVAIHSEGPVAVKADRMRLRQVIDNLLSNAIKYNRDGGEVTIGLTAEDDTVWLIVRDTGIGIADSDQERLFERFFRAPSVRNSPVHGTGLGLAISRDIARAHGGDLTLTSVQGEGTTAVVTLPLSPRTVALPGPAVSSLHDSP